jgi:hypothetical protein
MVWYSPWEHFWDEVPDEEDADRVPAEAQVHSPSNPIVEVGQSVEDLVALPPLAFSAPDPEVKYPQPSKS